VIVRAVRLSIEARQDLVRLADFLAERNPRAADRASQIISTAVISLSTLSERAPVVIEPDWRELKIRFGRAGYVARYRVVDEQVVFVSRIFHTLERR